MTDANRALDLLDEEIAAVRGTATALSSLALLCFLAFALGRYPWSRVQLERVESAIQEVASGKTTACGTVLIRRHHRSLIGSEKRCLDALEFELGYIQELRKEQLSVGIPLVSRAVAFSDLAWVAGAVLLALVLRLQDQLGACRTLHEHLIARDVDRRWMSLQAQRAGDRASVRWRTLWLAGPALLLAGDLHDTWRWAGEQAVTDLAIAGALASLLFLALASRSLFQHIPSSLEATRGA